MALREDELRRGVDVPRGAEDGASEDGAGGDPGLAADPLQEAHCYYPHNKKLKRRKKEKTLQEARPGARGVDHRGLAAAGQLEARAGRG